jgi:DNA-binding NarL/FixJ family response regulator
MLASVFAGAKGYLLKEIGGESLVNAVKAVATGQSILDPAATRALIDSMRSLTKSNAGESDPLSPQERRVLTLVAQGRTNKEIAAAMRLSPKTVKNYLSRVYQKLQVSRRTQAAMRFSQTRSD